MPDERRTLETREPADEKIEPPAEFVEQANVSDGSVLESFEEEGRQVWGRGAELLDWRGDYDAIFEENDDGVEWFPGGTLNASENCLDRHAEERGDACAVVWEGQAGERRKYSYDELLREVNAVASALRSVGVEEDDVVTLYMPVVPELPIAMLACARIGAQHVVVFTGYSAEALTERMRESGSTVLFTCDGYYRRGDAVSLQNRAETARVSVPWDVTTVVVDRFGSDPGGDSHAYESLIEEHADEDVEAVERGSNDELFYIYTSGTTGEPKRVTHTTGGYLSHAVWTSHAVLDLKPEDTYWCSADIGWITGHTYVVYGPLALGTTVLLNEGATYYSSRTKPWELIEQHGVDVFYSSPSSIRNFVKWGKEYPGAHDLSSLRLLGTVGEPINPRAWRWFYEHVGNGDCPVVDTWWQTETGGHLITTLPGVHDMKPGAAGFPVPGVDAEVVDADGNRVESGTGGYLTITDPWPGMPRELSAGERWAEPDDEGATPDTSGFDHAYFTEDSAFVDEDGYVTVIGRVDDVIKVSGHRFGTMEIESAIADVEGVAEAAVVDARRDGRRVMDAYVSPSGGSVREEEVRGSVLKAVEEKIGSFARPDRVVFTSELPKTTSGKTVRRLLTDLANDEEPGDTSVLRNPEVVGEIRSSLREE